MIRNRFAVLLAEKERRDGRRWRYEEIREAAGVNPATLTKYARQYVTVFDFRTLARLCAFLECEIGDLLVRLRDA